MNVLEGKHTIGEFLEARNKLDNRRQEWSKWLIRHGYEAGRHYWTCKEGYRFSSGGIATAFVLGVSK